MCYSAWQAWGAVVNHAELKHKNVAAKATETAAFEAEKTAAGGGIGPVRARPCARARACDMQGGERI